MTEEHAKLRTTAAGLRLKAATGLAASAAARDLVHIIPAALAKVVGTELSNGELRRRWDKALADATESFGPDPTPEELTMAALADVLAWHQGQALQTAQAYLKKIEEARLLLEGRAAGIEEALGVLCSQVVPEGTS